MSYDLMLHTYPNRDITPHDLDSIQHDLRQSATLQRLCEITPGKLAPSHVDVLVLGEGLDFGDFTEHEFTEFCSSRGLPADRHHEGAAAAFFRSRYGLSVATFKLPTSDDDARTAYSEIIQLALRHGLRVADPQKGDDVDLQKPGLLPPMWST